MKSEYDIFISYRREGAGETAYIIYQQLGTGTDALNFYQKGMDIRKKLARQSPGNARHQSILKDIMNKLEEFRQAKP